MRLLLLALLAASLCAGQAADEGKSAITNVMGAEYPKVHADLSVTFKLKAPEAQKVQVDISAKKYDMQKSADGVWDVTTPPQVVGFHYYQLWVDGVSVPDPGSDTFFGVGRQFSGIEIPESGVDYDAVKNVPHGQVRNFQIGRAHV